MGHQDVARADARQRLLQQGGVAELLAGQLVPQKTGRRPAHVLEAAGLGRLQQLGRGLATGRTPWEYGVNAVLPASDADVAEVLRESEERARADADHKAKLDAKRAADKRCGELRGEISRIMSMRVPEDVLIRALAVLMGEV